MKEKSRWFYYQKFKTKEVSKTVQRNCLKCIFVMNKVSTSRDFFFCNKYIIENIHQNSNAGLSLCRHADASGATDSPAKIRVRNHGEYRAGWYRTLLFLTRVAHSRHTPNRASSRAAEAPPTSVYTTMAAPSGSTASSGTRTSIQQSANIGSVFLR